VRAAAAILGVHENTARNMAADGRLPVAERTRSGYTRFDLEVVQALSGELEAAARQRAVAVADHMLATLVRNSRTGRHPALAEAGYHELAAELGL